jgi:hypothetical protein
MKKEEILPFLSTVTVFLLIVYGLNVGRNKSINGRTSVKYQQDVNLIATCYLET